MGEQPETREARLRSEYGSLYPYLVVGLWEPAAIVTDRVIAYILGRPDGRFITGERALDPAHFEFRGSPPRPAPGQPRRREEA